jgi:hypothetical protein
VDEGNNWININWGPLSLIAPTSETNPSAEMPLSDYSLAAGSPAINYVTASTSATTYAAAPADDFFGNLRKSNGAVDAGAVEFASTANAPIVTGVAPNAGSRGGSVNVALTGTSLTGTSAVTVSGANVGVSNIVVVNDTTVTATFTIGSGATLGQRNVSITTPGGTATLNNAFRVVGATVTFSASGLNTGGRTAKDGTITVTNTATGGNAGPLTLTAAPTFTQTGGTGTFNITGGTCASGSVLSTGGGSCTITAHYVSPAAPASVTSTMRINLANTGAATNPLQSQSITGN